MNVADLQACVAERLAACETLVKGGCKVLAEDTREVYDETRSWIAGGGVAVVVSTPRLTRDGDDPRGIPLAAKIAVRCVERPPTARETGAIRALDAAMAAAHALDGETFRLESVEQTFDRGAGAITATAAFDTSLIFTND